jgi:hypothetical protein
MFYNRIGTFDVELLHRNKMDMLTLKATYEQLAIETILYIHKNQEPG